MLQQKNHYEAVVLKRGIKTSLICAKASGEMAKAESGRALDSSGAEDKVDICDRCC